MLKDMTPHDTQSDCEASSQDYHDITVTMTCMVTCCIVGDCDWFHACRLPEGCAAAIQHPAMRTAKLASASCLSAMAQQSSGLSRKLHLAGSGPEPGQKHPAHGTQKHPALMQQPATIEIDHTQPVSIWLQCKHCNHGMTQLACR